MSTSSVFMHSVGALLVSSCARQIDTLPRSTPTAIEYPPSTRTADSDEYHGVVVSTPYRWLEASETPEVQKWITAQQKLTARVLSDSEFGALIRRYWETLPKSLMQSNPIERGGRYFFTRNEQRQDHAPLYVSESVGGDARLLLDPNTLAPDGTVSMADFEASPDGHLLAYALSINGSDLKTWHVLDVASAETLPGSITPVLHKRVYWNAQSDGLFYLRQPTDDVKEMEVCLWERDSDGPDEIVHVLERLVGSQSYFLRRPGARLYLGTLDMATFHNSIDLLEFDQASAAATRVPFIESQGAFFRILGEADGMTVVVTNLDAPGFRVVGIPDGSTDRESWREILPDDDETLRGLNLIGGRLVTCFFKDVQPEIRIYNLDGSVHAIAELPSIGTFTGLTQETSETEAFYSFETTTSPPTIYQLDLQTGQCAAVWNTDATSAASRFVTQQVFYESKDGTRVPMFVSHKKGLRKDGCNPTILAGYGGFGASITPRCGALSMAWMEMGGVYALANVRGGGEYGEEWHQAATKLNKQNTFDDFITAAEWLVDEEYTSSRRLALLGTSNGGLLLGAFVTQRPELAGAALLDSGLLDMLRIEALGGPGWHHEYGSPEDPAQFEALHSYSPVHNVRPQTAYPAMLVSASLSDDRVAPAHSYKFVAALQDAQKAANPIILRTQAGGHGASPLGPLLDLDLDRLVFLIKQFELEDEARRAFSN
ncbi:MAG: prolyl oligopeptidase [Chlamydiales bacterium]|jgi:prolyl oligopeptidase